jgi:PGF-pre-PGF domain-containing protein
MVSVMAYLKNNPLQVTALLILLSLLVLMTPAGAATITISPGTGAIQAAVSHAQSGDTIVLSPGTYRENGITITGKSLTFTAANGHGPSDTVIDAQSAGRIINVTDTSSLTVTRLGFKNAVADGNGGGAIYSQGTVTVTGSTFTNCSTTGLTASGGAIRTGGNLVVSGSTFTNCSTSGNEAPGGALFATGSLTVTDSLFSSCSTDDIVGGGALFSMGGAVTVTGSHFTHISSNNGQGGVIYSSGNYPATIRSSTFTDCYGGAGGGAVTANDNLTVTGSTFTNCSANYRGGALKSGGAVTVTGSGFTNCSAGGSFDGGAVYADNNLEVTGSTFNGCSATDNGGAIHSASGTVTVASSTFMDCSAAHHGGAVSGPAGATVAGSTFTDCSGGYGGALAAGSATVGTSAFTNCSASLNGGALWATSTAVDTSTFTNCSATSTSALSGNGGAIFSTGTVTADSSTFTRCSASGTGVDNGYGGAITSVDVITVTGSTITGCSAVYGSAVSGFSGGTLHFNRLVDNDAGPVVYGSGAVLDTRNNWWGSNANPSGHTTGTVTTSPWLVLGITASPFSGGPTTPVRANLTWNLEPLGTSTDTSALGHLPDEIPVTFTLTGISGTFNPVTGSTTSGVSTTTFEPASGGLGTVTARVDNQDVSVPITLITVFTGTPVSGTVPLTVAFSDTSGFSPAMWNWSFGDGNWSNTTDAAAKNPTHTYAAAGTYTVSLTTSGGYGTDTFSRPGYISVTAPGTPGSSSGDSGRRTSFVVTSPGTAAGGTMTFGIGQPLSAGGVDYTYAITTVAIVPSETLGSTDLIVTDAGATSHPPDGRTTAGIVAISPVAVNPSAISSGMITFAVSESWLSAHGLTPVNIVLMRYHDGTWAELPTTYQFEAGNAYYFTATTPGFSYFAIANRNITASTNATVTEPAAASVPVSITHEAAMTSAVPASVKVAPAGTIAPVTTATTAVPAGATGSSGIPVLTILAGIGGIAVMAVGAVLIRRWWIRRQNPSLFRKYD